MQENKVQNSYLPLFRKYRPQSFKDVIGQEFTVKALENAIKLNKIANAYLFCGPRGTGNFKRKDFCKVIKLHGRPDRNTLPEMPKLS